MPNDSATNGQRLWNYCNVLRDDEIEKELNETLPSGDDMLWSAFETASYNIIGE